MAALGMSDADGAGAPITTRPPRPGLGCELAGVAGLTGAALAGVALGAAIATGGAFAALSNRAGPLVVVFAAVGLAVALLAFAGRVVSRSWRLKRAAASARRLWRKRLTPWLALLWLPAITLVVFGSGATLILALAVPAIVIGFAWMIVSVRRAAARLTALRLALWALTGLAMGWFVAP